MIVDSLSALPLYRALHKRFETVYNYIQGVDMRTITDGRYDIDGDDIYMTVLGTDLRPKEEAPLETHYRYIDIQIVLSGNERYGWKDRQRCAPPRGDYNPQTDLLLYEDKPVTYFTLGNQEMAIFFPWDAHAPLIGEGRVRKCIIKVRY